MKTFFKDDHLGFYINGRPHSSSKLTLDGALSHLHEHLRDAVRKDGATVKYCGAYTWKVSMPQFKNPWLYEVK